MNSRNTSVPVKTGKTVPPTHAQVTALAHEIWQERGCPEGSDIDIWLEAERQLNGVPPRPVRERDPIPADPSNPDADSDPALTPDTDREINDVGGRPAARSVTDYDV